MKPVIHKSTYLEKNISIGKDTKIWNNCHIRSGVKIGEKSSLGFSVYIDSDVIIGNNVKIQNGVSIYSGVTFKDFVFCGQEVTFITDKYPRAKFPKLDRNYTKLIVEEGATIGGNSTIVCVNRIGRSSLIGAGSVVTKDVLDYTIVVGNPAKVIGYICDCGRKLKFGKSIAICDCGRKYKLIKGKVTKVE